MKLWILALTVATMSIVTSACKQSSKKSGAQSEQPPITTPMPTTPIIPTNPTPSLLSGTTCKSKGLISQEEKTIVIDLNSLQMQIQYAGNVLNYTLAKSYTILNQTFYKVTLTDGSTTDTGTLVYSSDKPRGLISIPFNIGDSKSLNATLRDCT